MRNEFKELAISTARKAGALLKEGLSLEKKIGYKGVGNLVTETDIKSQELIVSEITKNLPDHGIISEENLEERTKARYLWIIDPLDGTTNYAHRYPIFSISMALAEEGEIILGVVHDPNFDELFFAEKGCGAFLNDKPIHVSKTALLNSSLLATGFPYYIRERPGKIFRYFQEFSLRSQGVRRAGSAALDLCALACGRIDGFWEEGLKPWDTAAGSLIVKEADGTLSKYDGSPFDIYAPQALATNTLIHQQMLRILKEV